MVRFRVQNRLILTFGLYALVVFGLGGLLLYERTRIAMERELGEKLVAVGSVVASETYRMPATGSSTENTAPPSGWFRPPTVPL